MDLPLLQYTSRAAQLYRKQLEKDAAKLAQADGGLSPVGSPTAQEQDEALFSSFAAPKPSAAKPAAAAAPVPAPAVVPPPRPANGAAAEPAPSLRSADSDAASAVSEGGLLGRSRAVGGKLLTGCHSAWEQS